MAGDFFAAAGLAFNERVAFAAAGLAALFAGAFLAVALAAAGLAFNDLVAFAAAGLAVAFDLAAAGFAVEVLAFRDFVAFGAADLAAVFLAAGFAALFAGFPAIVATPVRQSRTERRALWPTV